MKNLICLLLFIALSLLVYSQPGDQDQAKHDNDEVKAKPLWSLHIGGAIKKNRNNPLEINLPTMLGKIMSSCYINFAPEQSIIFSGFTETFSGKKDPDLSRFYNIGYTLSYGRETRVKNLYLRNDLGFGLANYDYLLVYKTAEKPSDSLHHKFEYSSNRINSKNNFFITYGTTLGAYEADKIRLVVSQQTNYYLTTDHYFLNNWKDKISISIMLGFQILK
jgi:hypothetical protein